MNLSQYLIDPLTPLSKRNDVRGGTVKQSSPVMPVLVATAW